MYCYINTRQYNTYKTHSAQLCTTRNSPLPLLEEGGTPVDVTARIEEGDPPVSVRRKGPLAWSMGAAAGEVDACVPAGGVDWPGRPRRCTVSANWYAGTEASRTEELKPTQVPVRSVLELTQW